MKLEPPAQKGYGLTALEVRVLSSIDPERGSGFVSIVETLGPRTDDGPSIDLTLRRLVKRKLVRVGVTTMPMGVGGSWSRYFLTPFGAEALKELAP
jgi:hypothetical protein